MSIKTLALGEGSPRAASAGLLILRVMAGLSLFLKHGLEKLTGYSRLAQHFPNPIHVGPHASLAYALLCDGICSILVVIGFATRLASFLIAVNLLVVFFLIGHAHLISDAHMELVWVYIAAFVAIVFAGPGEFSLDAMLRRR